MAVKPLPFAFNAQTVSGGITQALTADLAVIRTQLRRGTKRRPPVELELHANPAALGVLAVGLGLGLWLTQQRIAPSLVDVYYGKWYWPDGTPASNVISGSGSNIQGNAPTRKVLIGTHTEYDHFGVPHEVNDHITETARWSIEDVKQEKHFVLRERAGFLGSGLGTITSDEFLKPSLNPVKWLTDPWGLFPQW